MGARLTVPVIAGVVLLGPLLVRLVDEPVLGLGLTGDHGAEADYTLVSDLGTEAGVSRAGLGHGGEGHDDIGPGQVVDVLVAGLVCVDVARGALVLVISGGGAVWKLGDGGGLGAVSLGAGLDCAEGEGWRL